MNLIILIILPHILSVSSFDFQWIYPYVVTNESDFIVISNLQNIFGLNISGDTDVNGPEPLVPHTTINEPALVPLAYIDGCFCREIPLKMSVFYGNVCKKFPKNVKVTLPILKFRNTLVDIIHEDDFQMMSNLTYMEIESNLKLYKMEPGCFKNMDKLKNLSISFNEKITHFDENLFEGLINLKEIYLRNNGFTKIIDVTKALSPKYVPNLLSILLNRNSLKSMKKHDFSPMEGTLLENLNLVLCQIEDIDPEVLKPLKYLKALRLGENLFSLNAITDLINTSISYGIPLQVLNLYEVGFRINPPKKLLKTIAKSNITYLNLGRNHFEHLDDDSFPDMPKLEWLVLRDVVTLDISNRTFEGMPNLKYLVLSGNHLTHVCEGILIKTLIILDLSSNSYTTDTHFGITDNVFKNMNNLLKLQLSYNQIEVLTTNMFNGLWNLRVLELNNAYLNNIEQGVFLPLKNLMRLNLENNFIGSDMILTPEIFKGLDNLQVLLLGGCHISNLTSHSLFLHMPKLYYLGLQRNGLHIISSNQFVPLKRLHQLDLSENNLTPWSKRLFSSTNLKFFNGGQNKFTSATTIMMEDFANLSTIMLDGNPFICDCSWEIVINWLKVNPFKLKTAWYPFVEWMDVDNFNVKKSYTDTYIATCVSPEKWRRHSLVDYIYYLTHNNTKECEIILVSNKVFAITFSTIFISLCIILGLLCYFYRWNLRYYIFLARKEIIRRQKQIKLFRSNKAITRNVNSDYKFDAFVSYCNEDQYFIDKLINNLENHDPYLKLCVYERDFQIGTDISENVMENIASSRRILLVVSDSFAKSQWCRWEMQLAECHQLYEDSEDGLILVILEKVTRKNMTPFLKYIMKTRIYLEWDSDERKERVFWDKLSNTLAAPKREI